MLRFFKKLCDAKLQSRIKELEHGLLVAKSKLEIVTLERDELLAVVERGRARLKAETEIEAARGVKARTGSSETQ
jgi:hypothetical protein